MRANSNASAAKTKTDDQRSSCRTSPRDASALILTPHINNRSLSSMAIRWSTTQLIKGAATYGQSQQSALEPIIARRANPLMLLAPRSLPGELFGKDPVDKR